MENQATDPKNEENQDTEKILSKWQNIWESLIRKGMGELTLRIGFGLLSISFVLMVIWVMGNFYLNQNQIDDPISVQAAVLPTVTVMIDPPAFGSSVEDSQSEGITRLTSMHTNIPAKARVAVIEYEVQKGDTIFGIAEKFNLEAETILWGNYDTLFDNPHYLTPGQILNILPINGVYYQWHAGDGLNSVSEYFNVTPEEIIEYEGNNLSMETIGDYANPNIEAGEWLIIPGGRREYVNNSLIQITRDNPAVASVMGAGYCGEVMDGPIGTGTFVWPSTEHWLSGYDYSPQTNHWGIDIGGDFGYPIYAIDGGVVVYAGWNDLGYGNMIIIDHGNGWQSLYAHLDTFNVGCGSYVYQGDYIGGMGSTGRSTGPHLHFEMRSGDYGRVNPWLFLP